MITKKIRIGNCEFNERITFKELLLKMKNQEIDYFTVTKLLADKDYYKQYVDDILTICQSCGINTIVDTTPGEEYYCITMSDKLCEQTTQHKIIFRKYAEAIDLGMKIFFPNYIEDGLPKILKFEDKYEIVRIPYKSIEELMSDLENVAIQIIAQLEPELGLKPFAEFMMNNGKLIK